jgi:hypothetical protein
VIERETGQDTNDLHEYFKRTLLPPVFKTVMGKEFKIPASTKDLNKAAFGEYLDKIAAMTGMPVWEHDASNKAAGNELLEWSKKQPKALKDGSDMAEDDYQGRERLPAAVYNLALRLGTNPELNRSTVHLKQTGRLKQLGSASWISFSATQTISTRDCAFDWRARSGPFGMVSVRDALKDGEGRLDVTALGLIPIARAEHSSALMRGERRKPAAVYRLLP